MGNLKSILLTFIQYISMIYLILAFPVLSKQTFVLIIQLCGLLLGVWAILVMSGSKLNITPVPRSGAILIQKGPYKLIRHPMYLSLLLVLIPMMIYNTSVLGWLVFGIFFINLIIKLSYEENLLVQTFEGYKNYQQHTWRLIPWVY